MKFGLTGFVPLYKNAMRLSFKSFMPWSIAATLLAATSFVAYGNVFTTLADRQNLSMAVNSNPAFNLILGTSDNLLTADGFTAWRSVVLGSFITAFMSILLVIRQTRSKEDSGEAEIVASSVVGRYTQTSVGLAVAWTASIFTGFLVFTSTVLLGGDIKTSILLGASLAASGIMFAGVAAVASQFAAHERIATSWAVGILGISYLLRGLADTVVGAEWIALFSPLGWIQKVDVAAGNNYWPFWVFLIFTVAVTAVAYYLKSFRDFGQGIISAKPGLERARLARRPMGLTIKLLQGSIISWMAAFMLLGSTFGYVIDSVGKTFSANNNLASFIGISDSAGADFTFEFARTLFGILGLLAAVYGVQTIIRLHGEETNHRADPLLAGSFSRSKLFASYSIVSLVGSAIAVLVSGGMVSIVLSVNKSAVSSVDIMQQSILTIPAIFLLVSIAIFAIGVRPSLRFFAWLAIVASFTLTLLGPILRLDDKILSLSPLWHIPSASLDSISLHSVFIMLAIAVLLIFLGFVGFNKRDIDRV